MMVSLFLFGMNVIADRQVHRPIKGKMFCQWYILRSMTTVSWKWFAIVKDTAGDWVVSCRFYKLGIFQWYIWFHLVTLWYLSIGLLPCLMVLGSLSTEGCARNWCNLWEISMLLLASLTLRIIWLWLPFSVILLMDDFGSITGRQYGPFDVMLNLIWCPWKVMMTENYFRKKAATVLKTRLSLKEQSKVLLTCRRHEYVAGGLGGIHF